MKLVFENLKGNYKEIIIGPFFKLIEAVLELMVPLVMAKIIDIGIKNSDNEYIIKYGGLLVLLAVLGFASAMICQYYAAVAGGRLGRDLRAKLYSHVLTLSQRGASAFGTGGLITRLTNDVNQVQNGLNLVIRLGARGPFLLIGSIVMALMVNVKIGLIFLISTPVVMAFIYYIMKKTLPEYSRIQSEQDSLSRLSSENLGGARVIRAFSRQKDEINGFNTASEKLCALIIKAGKLSASLTPLNSLLINMAIIGIVWFGANFANMGILGGGEILALVSYMTQSLLALTVAANLTVTFTRAIASAKRIEEVLEIQPSIKDGEGAKEVEGAAALEFSGVNFAYYKNADNALTDISFALPKGGSLGIIGGTGSGKSTIAYLINRMYDADSGTVLINGANIKNYKLSTVRSKIGMVPQRASLISGSIRRNMQMANQNAGDDEIWQALETAQAADFVKGKDGGLDYIIEEGGKNLSGGQRQRLTIARAIVGRPEIIILDDSSSALDYATDAALRKALNSQVFKAVSLIIISQRAAGIKNCDNIVVMDEGRIDSMGSHERLLRESGIYREICASQGLAEKGGAVNG